MSIKSVIKDSLVGIIRTKIKDSVVSHLMGRYADEIVALEDPKDPMKPSLCIEEFEQNLAESIDKSIVVTGTSIKFGVGNEAQLGFDRDLDENTTDCLRIVGTIIQGISGEYVLVTSDMAKEMFPGDKNTGDLGRTGRAYLMSRKEYDRGVELRDWEPQKNWSFSNFEGVPDFFEKIEIDLGKYIESITNTLGAD